MAGIQMNLSIFIAEKDITPAIQAAFKSAAPHLKILEATATELESSDANHSTKALTQHVCRHDEHQPCDHKVAITAASEMLSTKPIVEAEPMEK